MTQESDHLDQQRTVVERMRDHSRRWQEYNANAPLVEFEYYDKKLRDPAYQGEPPDPDPYVETVRMIPWLLGALLAVMMFLGIAAYIIKNKTWQMSEPVLTFVQPVKNPRWVK